MNEQWYAIIDDNTGDLVSTGTIVGTDLPAHFIVEKIDGPPPDRHVWHNEKRCFHPLPPIMQVDRLDDILCHYAFPHDLTEPQLAGIKEAILTTLGRMRFRYDHEQVTI